MTRKARSAGPSSFWIPLRHSGDARRAQASFLNTRPRRPRCTGLRNQVDGLERRSASSARRTARRDPTSARITKLAMPRAMRPSITLTERKNQPTAPSGSLRTAGSNRRANASKARTVTAANHRHVIHAIPWPHFRPDVAMVKPASQGTFPNTGAGDGSAHLTSSRPSGASGILSTRGQPGQGLQPPVSGSPMRSPNLCSNSGIVSGRDSNS
jgi:hypothetical protein